MQNSAKLTFLSFQTEFPFGGKFGPKVQIVSLN